MVCTGITCSRREPCLYLHWRDLEYGPNDWRSQQPRWRKPYRSSCLFYVASNISKCFFNGKGPGSNHTRALSSAKKKDNLIFHDRLTWRRGPVEIGRSRHWYTGKHAGFSVKRIFSNKYCYTLLGNLWIWCYIGLHMGPNNLYYVTRHGHVTFYNTLDVTFYTFYERPEFYNF